MWLDEDLSVYKRDLALSNPYVNSPGTLGFAPDPHVMPFLEYLGTFITNPISRYPRQPAKSRCCLSFPGGFLLHTGLPNPGISQVIRQYRQRWAHAPLPVIPHLLAETSETVHEMVRKLEGLENVIAVELGLPVNCDVSSLLNFLESASGEYPVIVSLSPGQIQRLTETLATHQPAAIHLLAQYGTLVQEDGGLISGRLFGPSFFPLTLSAAKTIIDVGLPVIAGCGVYKPEQAKALLDIGAYAVSLHAVLWGIISTELFE